MFDLDIVDNDSTSLPSCLEEMSRKTSIFMVNLTHEQKELGGEVQMLYPMGNYFRIDLKLDL